MSNLIPKDPLYKVYQVQPIFGDVRPNFVLSDQDGVLVGHVLCLFKIKKIFAALQKFREETDEVPSSVTELTFEPHYENLTKKHTIPTGDPLYHQPFRAVKKRGRLQHTL